MNHVQLRISANAALREVLIAELGEMDFDGFEETGECLYAYIQEGRFAEADITTLADRYAVTYEVDTIPAKNWNETWEANFSPVIVDDFCTIRASFHNIQVDTLHEIVITPKMSFGTGHHATTQLVIREMRHVDFKGKTVFDYGTGTGILAILAERLGAKDILAIDNDEWSYENAAENIETNGCNNVKIEQNTIDGYSSLYVDVILANINRHILLDSMDAMSKMLKNDGLLIMSGLLKDDKEVILQSAEQYGLRLSESKELNGWIVLSCVKRA